MKYLNFVARSFTPGDHVFGKGMVDLYHNLMIIAKKYRHKTTIFNFADYNANELISVSTNIGVDDPDHSVFVHDVMELFGHIPEGIRTECFEKSAQFMQFGSFHVSAHASRLMIVDIPWTDSVESDEAKQEEFIEHNIIQKDVSSLNKWCRAYDILAELVARYDNCLLLFKFKPGFDILDLETVYIYSPSKWTLYHEDMRDIMDWLCLRAGRMQAGTKPKSGQFVKVLNFTEKTKASDILSSGSVLFAGIGGELVEVSGLTSGNESIRSDLPELRRGE